MRRREEPREEKERRTTEKNLKPKSKRNEQYLSDVGTTLQGHGKIIYYLILLKQNRNRVKIK